MNHFWIIADREVLDGLDIKERLSKYHAVSAG